MIMFKEDVTKNIYSYWLKTLTTLSHEYTKRLEDLTLDEIEHLIWVLQEELKTRPKGE